MKLKHTLTLLFALIAIGSIYAQDLYTQKQGKTTMHEVEMTEYEQDPDAEAVVIYHLGDYSFEEVNTGGMVLQMTVRKKIKILKQADIKYAEIEIPYYVQSNRSNSEEILYLKGVTYNLVDGKIQETKLDKKKIFDEKRNENYRIKKIALPDVREGSVIEYSYTLQTPYFGNMKTWFFQDKIPVIESYLKYKSYPYFDYAFIVTGTNVLDSYNKTTEKSKYTLGNINLDSNIYNFRMKDIPAFKDEQYVSSPLNYVSSIKFQLAKIYDYKGHSTNYISTWPKVSNKFLDSDQFGKYIKNAEKEATKIIPTLGLEDKTDLQKLEIINKYVKDNYSWNEINGKYANEKLGDFLKQKTGNVGNINLFMIGLLRSAGIETYPVVLSTRGNGGISTEHPFENFFNYTVALVTIDNKSYLSDATEQHLYHTTLPERCVNVYGLVVKPKLKEAEWLLTTQESITSDHKSFEINVDPNKKTINPKAIFINRGKDAYHLRKEYAGSEDNLKSYYKKRHNINITDSIKVANYKRTNQPFAFEFKFDASVEGNNDKLFLAPFCKTQVTSNPFKQNSRTLPVDLIHNVQEIYHSKIEIPDGYKVDYLPKQLTIDNTIIDFIYTTEQTDKTINIRASYTLKKSLYQPEEYADLKMTMAKVIEQLDEIVILSKM